MLHAHVVEDQQVWLEISVENPVMTFEGFVVQPPRTVCSSYRSDVRKRSLRPRSKAAL